MKKIFEPIVERMLPFLSAILVLGATACSDDETGNGFNAYFERTSISFSASGGSETIDIVGDYEPDRVLCRDTEPWCIVKKFGRYITVQVKENPTQHARSANVYLIDATNNSDICPTLSVTQYGKTESGGNTGGNTSGSNTGGSGTTTSRPSAPTRVTVDNYGSLTYPDIRVGWVGSTGATSYKVYRSGSANGSYALRGTTGNTYYSDSGCKIGNVYYYKVKAVNAAGESDYSAYAEFNFKDNRKRGLRNTEIVR